MKLAIYTATVSVLYMALALTDSEAAQVLVIPFVALLLAPMLWKELV